MKRACTQLLLSRQCSGVASSSIGRIAPLGHRNGMNCASATTSFVSQRCFSSYQLTAQTSANLDRRRAKLLYQAQHRGILEMDMIFGKFAADRIAELSESQLNDFEKLVTCDHNEWDIYYWVTDSKPVPPEFDTEVYQMVKKYAWENNASLRAKRSKDS